MYITSNQHETRGDNGAGNGHGGIQRQRGIFTGPQAGERNPNGRRWLLHCRLWGGITDGFYPEEEPDDILSNRVSIKTAMYGLLENAHNLESHYPGGKHTDSQRSKRLPSLSTLSTRRSPCGRTPKFQSTARSTTRRGATSTIHKLSVVCGNMSGNRVIAEIM
jgi:hypothetical protein